MKTKKIIYSVLKILFVLAMGGSAIGKLAQAEQLKLSIEGLGYPLYLMNILGVSYLLGIIGIYQSKVAFLREWAYAGFTIALVGAFFSHLLAGEPITLAIPVLVLLIILGVTYYLEKQLQSSNE